MPFLRRRGNMASESDMRRQSALVDGLQQQPQSQSQKLSLSETSATAPTILEPPLEPSRSTPQTDARSEGEATRRSSSQPPSPPVQEGTPKHKRFSVLRFRNASDSQLSVKARQQAEKPPPVPRPPEIITTAPTLDVPNIANAPNASNIPQRKPSRLRLADRFRKSSDLPRNSEDGGFGRKQTWIGRRTTGLEELAAKSRPSLAAFEESLAESSASRTPPTAGDNESAAHAPTPSIRASESSRSDAGSGNHTGINATTPNRQSPPGGGNFFRLPRRKNKTAGPPLFDLSHLPQKSKLSNGTGHPSNSGSSFGVSRLSRDGTPRPHATSRPPSNHSTKADSLASSATGRMPKNSVSPATALFRPGSTHSGQSSPTKARLQLRGRSSTLSSLGHDSVDDHLQPGTTRTSSSTGRKSLGDMFGLNRLRQNPELANARQGTLTPATPGSNASKNNSLQLIREPVVLPEKFEDETAVKYLARIEPSLSRGTIASALSKPTDPFFATVLRSYMRRLIFFGDPMDMAIRKLLMEAELPKETQQIDRCLQAFANRYHECNPGIYSSPDQAYFIAFSLLILHTDVFNRNNKHKMQQPEYIKNTRGEGVFEPILKCFYDNITYTPFIHVEDDVDLAGERQRAKRKPIFPGASPDARHRKSSKEPLDPYTLILDGKLDVLRPSLKEVMELEDHYHYLGTAKSLNVQELQRTFFRTGVLQIVSARSRPDAFRDENRATNPDTAPQGVVDIKVTKVGLLWRKDAKKKKTRSPWQEWGAILTGAQLYFFRDTNWVKGLMSQYETHIKQGYYGEPITFKPALVNFKPDAFMPIKEAVALVDSTYKRHKHAFRYARPGAFVEEVLLADNEEEMNDWLAKLNYAAAFTTSGVRMRGVVGGNYEGQSRRGIRRLDGSNPAQIIQTPTGDVSIARGKIDLKEAESILAQRHETMLDAVAKAEEDIAVKEKELEENLRNARHLQILSPIQAKSRDELLREAARMDVKIKWVRMEIWRIKCHGDVLAKDLEEEGITANLSPTKSLPKQEASDNSPTRDKSAMQRIDSRSSAVQGGHQPTAPASLLEAVSPTTKVEIGSSIAEVPQTPKTSAAHEAHRHQRSWDSSMTVEEAFRRARSASHATASSGAHPTPNSAKLEPPRTPEKQTDAVQQQHSDDVDAGERNLLEQAGLLESPSSHAFGGGRQGSVSEADASESRDPGNSERLDRTKMRRSLQRTLRESAGHLSHHRSKRGKESVSSGGSEDAVRDDILSRGTGSFVVHGKKASVIDFGEGLQQMPTEERIRQRMQAPMEEEPLSPSSTEEDFYDAPGHQSGSEERRESGASASTATAKSFRELHRKYSSAARQPGQTGKLSVPSDTESEAAISVSEGRRTPLPPIENEAGEDEEEPKALLPGQSRSQLALSQPSSAGEGPASSSSSPPATEQQQRQQKSPEADEDLDTEVQQQLSNPHMQAVKA